MKSLRENFDAVVLAGGAEDPRPLNIPGAEMPGVRLAMEFLTQQNRRVAGLDPDGEEPIIATGKKVIILGGGDTGPDCLGTAHRHGAASVSLRDPPGAIRPGAQAIPPPGHEHLPVRA